MRSVREEKKEKKKLSKIRFPFQYLNLVLTFSLKLNRFTDSSINFFELASHNYRISILLFGRSARVLKKSTHNMKLTDPISATGGVGGEFV